MLSAVSRSPFALEDDPVAASTPRYRFERRLALAVVVFCCGYVLWQLSSGIAPWRLELGAVFRDTTTSGGDTGAHVWWPAFLRDHWFPVGRLAGWSPDWYAGFPVGQFYFPLPAVAIVLLDLVLPYNVAFKLVTVSGAVLLPYAAYVFARGLRFPWPAPPLFAVAAVRYLFEVRRVGDDNTWTIYGGNLASLLAGEFSYTLALAFALMFLGTLGEALERGRRPWLPAVLLAAVVLSHIVVAAFAAVGALLVLAIRRPGATLRVAAAIGVVGALLSAIWTVPLLATQHYTTSMRYEKVTTYSDMLLDLPTWVWALMFVAVVAAGWWRRPTTVLLLGVAVAFAVLFRFWPEHHVWNTRFLPFYWLAITLLAACGAVELVRHAAAGIVWIADWVYTGTSERAAAREPAGAAAPLDPAPGAGAGEPGDAIGALVGADPPVADPLPADPAPEPAASPEPAGASEAAIERRRSLLIVGARLALAAVVVVSVLWWVDGNRYVAPGWASWNYRGYEEKAAWSEYRNLMATMDAIGREAPGRALWEPSSDINAYGTTLALELLPYWTDGRIGSMEGLYFESAATTPYHFLTVSELSADGNPSNPVRGLLYGSIADFDLGVDHLQRMGVRYFLAQSDDAKRRAGEHPDLTLVAQVPDADGAAPHGWDIFEVADAPLVEGLAHEPVVAALRGGTTSTCFRSAPPSASRDPQLNAWECAAAPWWRDADALDRPFTDAGPQGWTRVTADEIGTVAGPELPPVEVSDIREAHDQISFRVDRVGVPVVVKASYFPNWQADGADGPWRISPNFMVVVPTAEEVTLRYATTPAEWLSRLLALLGVVGLVLLVRWRVPARWQARPAEPVAGGTSGGGDLAGADHPGGPALR
jgi:hypothetical protein